MSGKSNLPQENKPIITQSAIDDQFEIWEYIAKDNVVEADRMLQKFADAFVRMGQFPRAGHRHEFIRDKSLRVWTVGSYLIVYRPGNPVEIVRVLHGRRDFPALFPQE